MKRYATLLVFISLVITYFFSPFVFNESSGIFVSIATFLFAIFAGFFISRQSTRLAEIGTLISNFDGNMNSMMRDFEHFGKETGDKSKAIINNHYNKILKSKQWDYHFVNKSTTLTDTHALLETVVDGTGLSHVQSSAVTNIFQALRDQQKIRT